MCLFRKKSTGIVISKLTKEEIDKREKEWKEIVMKTCQPIYDEIYGKKDTSEE